MFSSSGSYSGLEFPPLVQRKPRVAPPKLQCIQEGPSSPAQDPSKSKHGNEWDRWGAINKGGGLSEVADKRLSAQGKQGTTGWGQAYLVPKYWFVELVKASRVLVRPQEPSERSRAPCPSLLLIFFWRLCLSLGMPDIHVSSGELRMYVFFRGPWAQAVVGCLPAGRQHLPHSRWPGCSGCPKDGWVGRQAPTRVTPCCPLSPL